MINWYNKWKDEKHKQQKEVFFNKVDNVLNFSPTSILDIGCGFAFESKLFQKKYNSEVYLLDGEIEANKRYGSYGETETFGFYNSIEDLKTVWKEAGLIFFFIDANNINIDKNKKFDLIYSFKSCGFHYPINTYLNLIKLHSHKDTRLVFDIRKKSSKEQLTHFDIVQVIQEDKVKVTAEIKLK